MRQGLGSRMGAWLGLGCVLLLAACTPAQLRMPDGFAADAAAWPVSGHSPRQWNEPVRFGPYSALQLEEGGTFGWGLPVGRVDFGRSERRYAFTLVAIGQAPVEVQCRVRHLALWQWGANGRVETRIEVDATALEGPMLDCGLVHDGIEPALPLALERKGTRLHGRLASPWGEYAVRSLHGYAGTPIAGYAPTGFELVAGGRTLMVVDLIDHGQVFLDPAVDESQRTYLAAAAAILLLLGEDAEA